MTGVAGRVCWPPYKTPMTWNYRIVKRRFKQETRYGIHEAYYQTKTSVKPHSISKEPIHAAGETLEDLKADHAMQMLAFHKPILNWEDF